MSRDCPGRLLRCYNQTSTNAQRWHPPNGVNPAITADSPAAPAAAACWVGRAIATGLTSATDKQQRGHRPPLPRPVSVAAGSGSHSGPDSGPGSPPVSILRFTSQASAASRAASVAVPIVGVASNARTAPSIRQPGEGEPRPRGKGAIVADVKADGPGMVNGRRGRSSSPPAPQPVVLLPAVAAGRRGTRVVQGTAGFGHTCGRSSGRRPAATGSSVCSGMVTFRTLSASLMDAPRSGGATAEVLAPGRPRLGTRLRPRRGPGEASGIGHYVRPEKITGLGSAAIRSPTGRGAPLKGADNDIEREADRPQPVTGQALGVGSSTRRSGGG